uniref:PH domain-containing protein n=1 Tax=Oncorhynchus tshawytscha TaxID=74940 RepID=A0AAZ3S927_ONCTS
MSTAKDNSCRKFQANIFNKSKCQNCFKPRELHLLTDQDLNQAKPIYGGWLCLAPEGTDFSNPMQRSRKWQRRFFVLYEHGCLRFALDESSSTLPQGTVNLNLCTDVIDAEPKTGQKNALCIITPEQEYFIRGENKEIINGWTEQLVVYPRTNKQNQKKKRKVEPTTSQEPGPAKVAVKGSGIPEGGSENVPDSSSIIWQEELSHREAEGVALWPAPDLPRLGSPQPSTGMEEPWYSTHLAPWSPSQYYNITMERSSLIIDYSVPDFTICNNAVFQASDLDGEIDLSTCYNVTEYQAQRNYGFQIHTREGLHTLSAMTAGIRRNWIQAVMKNVRPSTAPDVASNHGSFSPLEGLVQPDVTQDSPSSETSSVEREPGPGPKKSRARERRQQGRSKTFDWGEFRPIAQALAQQRAQKAEPLQTDIGDPDRNRRREERRRSPGGECVGPPSLERQQKVEVEIEQRWQQVEQTPIRDERRVTLPSTLQTRETAKLEKLLESYKKGHKQNLEVQLRTALEREQHVRSGYVSQATCERGFAAMEESHQRVIEELQRKNQRALENLHEEKERLLAEETAATIAAIEAMKNAHRSELEKELDKARKSNSNTENADIEEICRQHEEELCSFQREIEVLSEQYSQKCLENAHLAQALEAERQALRQCQRENQELNAHNQELNNRLAAEITKMRSMATEDGGGNTCNITHGKELYELEVMLRVKESEVQYLKQEINSLRDELQAAQRDKKYATDKYKDIYTELSIVKAKAERDLGRLREQLQLAHEALGEPSLEEVERAGGYDIMKSKSNPDILKMAAAAAKRTERIMRSKV